MAYNSDGYIMIDFTEVDFRRTNQTIEGLYKRCVDVIGTNKFILVINANGRTPLPATCSFTNNQYVIDTVIYMFAVSSNDNLFIRRNDVPASDIINDDVISVDTTWSSNKIDSELDTKADSSALADYQPLLTPGTNITIDENNVISASGGVEIDDAVIVNNKVWSSLNTVEKLAPIDTIINNPAVFNTSLVLPLVECNVIFNATQSGTGTPSPNNPRPIVGVSAIDVVVNGNTISESFGGTYYGGVLDVLSGLLTIDKGFIEYDGSEDESWSYRAASNGFSISVSDMKPGSYMTDGLCNWLPIVTSLTTFGAVLSVANRRIYCNQIIGNISGVSDLDTWKTYLSVNSLQVVYPLEIPITIQLTPEQINTIVDTNTISTTADTLKVSYKYLPNDQI